jgi:hypothetical protein
MAEPAIVKRIERLDEGQTVAFAVDDQNWYKLQWTYTVSRVYPDGTVDVAGPQGGSWRVVIEDGRPHLKFERPSTGWTNAGILDYLEAR